ncbi:MAG: protein kinase [Acidobacteriia bacterium]|nr:protein kinase [Terriglobia bacterium]
MIPIDTTGLPPGGTFAPTISGPTNPMTAPTLGDAATIGPTPTMGGTGVAAHKEAGPLKVGQSFGPRYHIIKLLGAGGMGAVYQAWDAELGVAVALKVIRTSKRRVSAELEKRFKNELLLARSVTHKNVVRIHDLGEIEGTKYITMSFIQGHDLSTLLRRDGKFSIARALALARQIAAGLEAAHEAGVVHRDLKPANIMIGADDLALIMDFGISASAEQATTGGVVGTLEYMAPEQGTGQAVDGRADIYALGLILYELLTGPRLTASVTPQERIEAMKYRTTEGLPPIRSVDPSIPAALDAVVMRCVERDPAARFQTTAELVAALAALDDAGELIPIARRLTKPMMAAAAAVVLLLLGGTYLGTRRLLTPPAAHEPVSVLIADFQNQTGDPTLDRALEPMVKRALEGAGFISAYDRNAISRILGVRPPENMDEVGARELAVKQGLGVVLSGSIGRQGNGYDISVKAAQTVTGNAIATAKSRASSKDQVLGTATKLVVTVRKALGDQTSESAQMFTMASLSATSLDVVHNYAAAMEAQSKNQFEEARQSFLKTVELDPKFGIGYQGLAVVSRNLGKLDDADKYIKEALRYLDGMTERERFSTRGMYYRVTGDYPQCVKEYGELVARYAGDAVGHNQRALCLSKLHDLRGAVEDMGQVVQMLPKRVVFRDNLSLYASYAGDFQTAEREARAVESPDTYAVLALAFARVGQGQLREATDTYQELRTFGALGASFSTSGLADLALYEGRLSDAVRTFEQGAAADLAARNPDKAATKLASLAYAHLLLGHTGPAAAAADKALLNSKAVPIRFLAARIFVETNAVAKARTLAAGLAAELPAEPQAYGKIIEGEIALKNGDSRQAITLLGEANGLLDTWLGHFDLGRAYLERRAFPQADSEFDRCIKRRGEALSLFLDEEPTYGYFPPVYYYQGRVREGLNDAGFAKSYRAYLEIRGKSTEDPLLPEVRRRAGQ